MTIPVRPTFNENTDFFPAITRFAIYAREHGFEKTDAVWTRWRRNQVSIPRIDEVKKHFTTLANALAESASFQAKAAEALRRSVSGRSKTSCKSPGFRS